MADLTESPTHILNFSINAHNDSVRDDTVKAIKHVFAFSVFLTSLSYCTSRERIVFTLDSEGFCDFFCLPWYKWDKA